MIYSYKKLIERKTGIKCCVVYGSLPPEIRKQQATLFNTPDNDYDILVASG
jgi:ATP-dependent RNA helicase SUPV3L1/SUV3